MSNTHTTSPDQRKSQHRGRVPPGPSAATAPRRAVPDYGRAGDRLGEVLQRSDGSYEARNRRGEVIGVFSNADAAIAAVRIAAGLDVP
jgi:hypothetical protein